MTGITVLVGTFGPLFFDVKSGMEGVGPQYVLSSSSFNSCHRVQDVVPAALSGAQVAVWKQPLYYIS